MRYVYLIGLVLIFISCSKDKNESQSCSLEQSRLTQIGEVDDPVNSPKDTIWTYFSYDDQNRPVLAKSTNSSSAISYPTDSTVIYFSSNSLNFGDTFTNMTTVRTLDKSGKLDHTMRYYINIKNTQDTLQINYYKYYYDNNGQTLKYVLYIFDRFDHFQKPYMQDSVVNIWSNGNLIQQDDYSFSVSAVQTKKFYYNTEIGDAAFAINEPTQINGLWTYSKVAHPVLSKNICTSMESLSDGVSEFTYSNNYHFDKSGRIDYYTVTKNISNIYYTLYYRYKCVN